MSAGQNILKIENFSAGYGDETILTDVALDLNRGEAIALIGQNGSGKSTFLKTLCGLVPKKSGNIFIGGQLQKQIEPYHLTGLGISYCTQGSLTIPALTVREHLELASFQKNKIDWNNGFEVVFGEFPVLKSLLDTRAGNLSGGERQILSFGILLIQHTPIWLLDEATAGLSPDMVAFSAEFLSRKKMEGISLLLVEHNMEVAFQLATNIVIAKAGSMSRKFERAEFLTKDFLEKYLYS